MRDISTLMGLICATVAAAILFYYAWPERKFQTSLRRMLYVIAGCMIFLWVSFIVMWFSV